jgi:hypothetical protein
MQALQRQEREETKNLLLDILKTQMSDVKRMGLTGDVQGLETIMAGLQTVSL